MSKPRHPIYRNALQLSPERIAGMDHRDLNALMRQLSRAQAYRFGSSANEIRVNTEGKARRSLQHAQASRAPAYSVAPPKV